METFPHAAFLQSSPLAYVDLVEIASVIVS